MAEPMEVENGHAAADKGKGKAPMANGAAAKPSRGYELPWVSGCEPDSDRACAVRAHARSSRD
jgi:hypothetical protein